MVALLADISSGHTAGAEIFLLVAALICLIGLVVSVMEKTRSWLMALLFGAIGCIAMAFLIL
jgi:hypothetical protein